MKKEEEKKECLWCHEEIVREEWEYQFCNPCLENLAELEAATRRITITEIAEKVLK